MRARVGAQGRKQNSDVFKKNRASSRGAVTSDFWLVEPSVELGAGRT